MNEFINRRDFLKTTVTTGVALGVVGPFVKSWSGNASSDLVRVAVIGTNSRGNDHAKALSGLPNVEVAYICDVDDRAIKKGIESTRENQKKPPKGLIDFRKALEDPQLDAVSIATPDHWHTPGAILALEAGKHVYLEKPCGHNCYEGEMLIKAVEKYKKVYQMGNQKRSSPLHREAIQAIHEGVIGQPYLGKCWYSNSRKSIGYGKPAPIPKWLDYELWQGPAPRRPYTDNIIHYNWHWFWHWGTGESNNNGTHEIDLCRWALGVDYPTKVTSIGGRYHYEDDWEAYDTQILGFEFPDRKAITWESRSCNRQPIEGHGRGVIIYGTEGSLLLVSGLYQIFDYHSKLVKEVKEGEVNNQDINIVSPSVDLDRYHFQNFIDAIRNGGQTNSTVEEGHKSNLLCHLGNIAQRTGHTLHCDPNNGGKIVDDKEAMALWAREYEPGWEPRV
jgi:predicted dehydrogenase